MTTQLDSIARLMVKHDVSPSAPDSAWSADERNPDSFRGDCALLLPSYQPDYVKVIGGDANRHLSAFPTHLSSSTFLDPTLAPGAAAFHWPRFLFSIYKDTDKPDLIFQKYPVLENLPNWVEVTFDTGGFHAAKGKYQFTGRRRIATLKLAEAIAHWAMTMDVPTFHGRPFDECLRITVRNLKWLLNHRKSEETKWFAICQGPNIWSALSWWRHIKFATFEGLEGIAYAGRGMEAYSTLKLMRVQMDQYAFDKVKRIHFLGRGKASDMIVLTIIKRLLRKYLGKPDFEVTADTATAFFNAGFLSQYFDGRIASHKFLGDGPFGGLVKQNTRWRDSDGNMRRFRADTQVWLNSPVNPRSVPMTLAEIDEINADGERVSNRLGMSIFATSNIYHQVWQIILAQREADAVLCAPKVVSLDAAVHLKIFVEERWAAGLPDSTKAELAAALEQYYWSNPRVGEIPERPELRLLRILQNSIEEILFGDKPDEALERHRTLLTSWF